MTIALFPGTFDPVTKGHVALLQRASKLFDKVIVMVGKNIQKQHLFSQQERVALLIESLKHLKNVEVIAYSGLVVDCAVHHNVDVILRGVRNSQDFEYEKRMQEQNTLLCPQLETLFLLSDASEQAISSSFIRELYRFDIARTKAWIPDVVYQALEKKQKVMAN